MTLSFYERQRELAIDWRDMVVEAMHQQKGEQGLPVTNPETAELVDMIDRLIDDNLNDWKREIARGVGVTRIGTALPFPDEIVKENLKRLFIERLNALLPLPFKAEDMQSRARWKDHFEIQWLTTP